MENGQHCSFTKWQSALISHLGKLHFLNQCTRRCCHRGIAFRISWWLGQRLHAPHDYELMPSSSYYQHTFSWCFIFNITQQLSDQQVYTMGMSLGKCITYYESTSCWNAQIFEQSDPFWCQICSTSWPPLMTPSLKLRPLVLEPSEPLEEAVTFFHLESPTLREAEFPIKNERTINFQTIIIWIRNGKSYFLWAKHICIWCIMMHHLASFKQAP